MRMMKGGSHRLQTGNSQSWGPCEEGLESDDRQLARGKAVACSSWGLVPEAGGRHYGPRSLEADTTVPGSLSLQLAKISLILLMSSLVKSPNLPEPLFSCL